MFAIMRYRTGLLFETSPEIERRPLIVRPRTTAAIIGGMTLCKVVIAVLVSPALGLGLLPLTIGGGGAVVAWRFRGRYPEPGTDKAALLGPVAA